MVGETGFEASFGTAYGIVLAYIVFKFEDQKFGIYQSAERSRISIMVFSELSDISGPASCCSHVARSCREHNVTHGIVGNTMKKYDTLVGLPSPVRVELNN